MVWLLAKSSYSFLSVSIHTQIRREESYSGSESSIRCNPVEIRCDACHCDRMSGLARCWAIAHHTDECHSAVGHQMHSRAWIAIAAWANCAIHADVWRCKVAIANIVDALALCISGDRQRHKAKLVRQSLRICAQRKRKSKFQHKTVFYLIKAANNSLSRVLPHPTIVPVPPVNRLLRCARVGSVMGWIEAENVSRRRRNLMRI